MISTAQPDDFLLTEPDPVYRQRAAQNLSSHALAEFRKCPLLYRKHQLGLVSESESSAFLLGRAAHCLILEGRDTYNEGFAIGGPINERTGKPYGCDTKAFNQWATELGKPVLSFDQAALIEAMAGGVADHPFARSLLTSGQAEGVVRLPYAGHACQGRFDWFSFETGLVDLKTCDDLTWFESDARRFGYTYQLAFYRARIREACGETPPVHIIAVEKREPYRCGVWRIADEILDQAERENLAAMRRLEQCQKTDTWPTDYEDLRTFDYL